MTLTDAANRSQRANACADAATAAIAKLRAPGGLRHVMSDDGWRLLEFNIKLHIMQLTGVTDEF